MASLAGMLRKSGYEIIGSDEHVYPPMSTFLEQLGIEVLVGYTKEHLEKFRPDLVVVGNAAARTNPEAAAVLELDLPYTSMPEAIHQLFLRGKHSIVAAGTHGKTTTTSLMAWVLEAAGRDPSFMVGGIPLNFNQNFKLGEGEEFVLEGDEYNTAFFDKGPKFVHYHASTLILNNIEFDHADIYDGLDQIMSAFRSGVSVMKSGDLIVANGDDGNVAKLRADSRAVWLTFGFTPGVDLRATDLEESEGGTAFTVFLHAKEWFRFRTTMSGRHNVANALAVAAVGRNRGLTAEQIQKGFETFEGVKRRMEVRGVEDGVTVIDDFAHHPTAVETTLRGARKKYPARRIWALFEPRSISSARKEFEAGYEQAFREADQVVIGPVFHRNRYETRYGLEKMMSVEAIIDSLQKNGTPARHVDDIDRIVALVASEAKGGAVIIAMSSGAFGGIHQKLLDALKSRGEKE